MNNKINAIKEKIDSCIEELMPVYLMSYKIHEDEDTSDHEKSKALNDMLKSNEILMDVMLNVRKDISSIKKELF